MPTEEITASAEASASTSLCAPAPVTPWFVLSASAPAAPPHALAANPATPVLAATTSLPPHDNDLPPEQLAAATLAGVGLVGALGWRLGRLPQLPFHMPLGEQRTEHAVVTRDDPDTDAEGWRLSRFDDLPEHEPVRPLKPLYDSLDDVIDVVPLPARS